MLSRPAHIMPLPNAVRLALVCCGCATAVVVASITLLAFALTFSSDSRIEMNLRKAVERGALSRTAYPVSPYGHAGHSFDMFTDCVAFGTNLSNRSDGMAYRIAAAPSLRPRDGGPDPCERLVDAVQAGTARADVPYLRFWHGYQAYTRPMLSVMALHNVRRLTAIIFYGALAFFAFHMMRWFGPLAAPAFLLPFFFFGDFLIIPILITHALHLTVIFISCALVPIIVDRFRNPWAAVLPAYVFSAGMITNFVSFLVNPPLAPTLIGFLAIAGALRHGYRQTVGNILYAAILVAFWFAGYFTEWIAKWAIAAVVLGSEAVSTEILSTVAGYGEAVITRGLHPFNATWSNLAPNWITLLGIIASLVGATGAIAFGVARAQLSRHDVVDFLSMLVPLLTLVAWVEANAAHSDIHVGFVCRSFLLICVIPLLAALLIIRRTSPKAIVRTPLQPERGGRLDT